MIRVQNIMINPIYVQAITAVRAVGDCWKFSVCQEGTTWNCSFDNETEANLMFQMLVDAVSVTIPKPSYTVVENSFPQEELTKA